MAEKVKKVVDFSFKFDPRVSRDGPKKTVDIVSLLSPRDAVQNHLIRSNGAKVKLEDICGKTVGLYFVGSNCSGWAQDFTKNLARVYHKLPREKFEVVLVAPIERDDDSFKQLLSQMPWPAIRFPDVLSMDWLFKTFTINQYPTLVFIDEAGNVSEDDWINIVRDYEEDAYPFTRERIDQLKEEDRVGKENITLRSLLESTCLICKDKKMHIDELEGKRVGLFFVTYGTIALGQIIFTRKLVKVYEELKKRGENFEIVAISGDEDEEDYHRVFEDMPWPVLPYKDRICAKLTRYYRPFILPKVVIFGPDGKESLSDVFQLVEDYGVQAYPFTLEKVFELDLNRREAFKTMTVESLLISEGKDFVHDSDSTEVPVSDLVGRPILFYFSCGWNSECHNFTGRVVEAYFELKDRHDELEVIYVPHGEAEEVVDNFVSSMPWLHVPYGDPRVDPIFITLERPKFNSVVALKPNGGAMTDKYGKLRVSTGEDVFSFIDEYMELLDEMGDN